MKVILPTELIAAIEPQLPADIEVIKVDPQGNLSGDAQDAEIYLNGFYLKSEILDRVLTAAPQIRWQQTPSAGVNHLLTPLARSRDMILTNGAGLHAIPIAEFVLALILERAKQLPKIHHLQTERDWQRGLGLQEIYGSTLLIIGAGGIGQAIAKRARGFGLRIWGSRRNPSPLPDFDRVVGAQAWRDLLPEADYVVIAAPLTPETKGSFDAAAFRALPRSAYVINIARGALVDEEALFTALQEGWIAGAAIDTFTTEPLPADSRLWSLPNLFITPHCSGSSPQTIARIAELFLDNFHRYQQGLPLRNLVDRSVGY